MIERLKARTPFLALMLFVFGLGYVFAHNKVAVVPLGGSGSSTGIEIIAHGLVQNDGTLFTGEGIVDVSKPITGVYQLEFDQEVVFCIAQATPFDFDLVLTVQSGGSSFPRFMNVSVRDALSGVAKNAAFHFTLSCKVS